MQHSHLRAVGALNGVSDCSGCALVNTCEHCEIDPEDDEEEGQTESTISDGDSRKLLQVLGRLNAGG